MRCNVNFILDADVTGFFVIPTGPCGQYAILGGLGASIVSYSEKQDAAFSWLEWFIETENQFKWAELGGFPCDKTVLESEIFLNATPYNKPYADTMKFVKDFWGVPEYFELLEVCQNYLYSYIVNNQYTAEKALDSIAAEWEAIFDNAGYYD